MLEPYFWTGLGLILLVLGGDGVVRGAAGLAKQMGISELLVGLVVVAFGTSAPELIVAIQSVSDGVPDVAVGNVIGSNIANILLVLGVGAMIAPIPMSQNVVFRDGIVVLAASGFLVWLGSTGMVSFNSGIVLTSAVVVYLTYSYMSERTQPAFAAASVTGNRIRRAASIEPQQLLIKLAFLIGGFAALFFGAKWLIYGAVEIARSLEVSEAVIGVTIVAIGTSVPELAAVTIAAIRRHPEVVLGSIVGSNIFNILVVIGITALLHPVVIAARFYTFDLWMMLAVVVIFLIFLASDSRLSRLEGLLMLLGYVAYITILFSGILPEVIS